MTAYEHYSDVPMATWRWASFSPREIACKGTGKVLVNEAALDKLQALRDRNLAGALAGDLTRRKRRPAPSRHRHV